MNDRVTTALRVATNVSWIAAVIVGALGTWLRPNHQEIHLFLGAFVGFGGLFALFGTLTSLRQNKAMGAFWTASREVRPFSYWSSIVSGFTGALVLFCASIYLTVIGLPEQLHPANAENVMNYRLDISGNRKIQNPTEGDIRQAVFALDTKKGDAFLVLGPTDTTYIQTSGNQKVGFDLEYQQGDAKHHFRAKRDFTADEVV